MMNRNNEGYKSTFIPSASGGLGVIINITPGIGVVMTSKYSVYFDTSVFITDFSPSAGVYLRL